MAKKAVAKPWRGWGIFVNGALLPWLNEELRKEAMAGAETQYGDDWKDLRKRGFSCRKVTIMEGW